MKDTVSDLKKKFDDLNREEAKLAIQEQNACARNDFAECARIHKERWTLLDRGLEVATLLHNATRIKRTMRLNEEFELVLDGWTKKPEVHDTTFSHIVNFDDDEWEMHIVYVLYANRCDNKVAITVVLAEGSESAYTRTFTGNAEEARTWFERKVRELTADWKEPVNEDVV